MQLHQTFGMQSSRPSKNPVSCAPSMVRCLGSGLSPGRARPWLLFRQTLNCFQKKSSYCQLLSATSHDFLTHVLLTNKKWSLNIFPSWLSKSLHLLLVSKKKITLEKPALRGALLRVTEVTHTKHFTVSGCLPSSSRPPLLAVFFFF